MLARLGISEAELLMAWRVDFAENGLTAATESHRE
jgi:hypothetical protein